MTPSSPAQSPLVVSDIQKCAAKDRKIAELTQQLQSIKRSAIKRTSLGDAAAWYNAGAGEAHQGEACTNIPKASMDNCELGSDQIVTKCKNSAHHPCCLMRLLIILLFHRCNMVPKKVLPAELLGCRSRLRRG